MALVLPPLPQQVGITLQLPDLGKPSPAECSHLPPTANPRSLLSQEYVLHLLPWAGPTQGRSPSGRAVGTVSIHRSSSGLGVRGHFLLLASTPDSGDLEAPFTWLGGGTESCTDRGRKAASALSSSPIPSKKSLPLVSAEGWSFGINQAPLCGRCASCPPSCYTLCHRAA